MPDQRFELPCDRFLILVDNPTLHDVIEYEGWQACQRTWDERYTARKFECSSHTMLVVYN
jgi:hypothetical protein